MKNIIIFITTSLMNIVKSAFWAALTSAVFCLFKWFGSLIGICENVKWWDFLGGGVGLFVLFFGYKMFWIFRDMYRRKKDPVYDAMANSTGISYKDYKKLRDSENK